MTRHLRSHGLLLVLALCATGVRAEEPLANEVVVAGCPGLSTREIARLVVLEVGAIAPDPKSIPTFALAVTCSGEQIFVNVDDSLTGKSLQRQVAMPRAPAGTERLLALTTAQLLRVSWMELLMTTPPPAPAPTPASPAVLSVAKAVAEAALAPVVKPPPPPPRDELTAVVGAAWRDLGSAYLSGQVGVRGAHLLDDRVLLCLQVTGELGRAERVSGAVSAWGAFAHVGAGWSSPRLGGVSFDATALVGVGYVQLVGLPATGAVTSGSVGGAALDARVTVGPTFHASGLVVAVEFEASFGAPRTVGQVTGERSVATGGFGLGARLRAGWAFGG